MQAAAMYVIAFNIMLLTGFSLRGRTINYDGDM